MRKKILILLFTCCWFLGRAQVQPDSASNKRNLLAVMPFQFTENGPGIGASYESSLDKRGLFAIYLPAIITFNAANTNRIYDYNTGSYNTGKTDPMFYAMPGFKFYPTGSYGKIKYATGASVVVGTGKQSSYLLDLNGLNTTELVQHHFLAGLMWQNSLSINIYARMYVGATLGLGGTLINKAGGNSESSETLVEGSVNIGCRF